MDIVKSYSYYLIQSKCKRWDWTDHTFPEPDLDKVQEEFDEYDGKVNGYEFRIIYRTVKTVDRRIN